MEEQRDTHLFHTYVQTFVVPTPDSTSVLALLCVFKRIHCSCLFFCFNIVLNSCPFETIQVS